MLSSFLKSLFPRFIRGLSFAIGSKAVQVAVLCSASGGLIAMAGCGWSAAMGANPLVVNVQPANVTIPAEQTAEFAVAASSDRPVTYQWYKSGSAIPGAISSSYKTSPMPLAENGAVFTVIATDGIGSVTSSPALLTVTPKQATLSLLPVATPVYGAPPFPVSSVSNSPGPISYAILSGPATISGSIVSVAGTGSVVVGASQGASGDYGPASTSTAFQVAPNVTIGPVSPSGLTMGPGNQPFAASVTGGPTDKISWTASGGSFSGNVWSSPNVAGTYTIVAASVDDPTKTASTSVIVSPPVITRQPSGGSFCPNTNLDLTVAAMYANSFQWNLNGAPLSAASNPSYATVANSTLDAGQYTATVTNPAGSVTSIAASVAIGSSIVTNPQSATVAVNQVAFFSTAATGVAPFSYQWYMQPPQATSGIAIQGATASSYATPPVNGTFEGNQYYVVVTDACSHPMTSTVALLSVSGVNVPPTIVVPPIGQSTTPGGTATFAVEAVGSPTLIYQWFRVAAGTTMGTPIYGATAAQYSVPNSAAGIANDQDQYYVVVTNGYGQASSQHVTLSVGAGILITQQPTSAYVQPGDSATYTVAATSQLPLTYQWYEADPGNSTFRPLPGATSVSYTLTSASAAQSGSNLYVIVSNGVTVPVQSNAAGLLVGSLASVPTCSLGWNLLGSAVATDDCGYELTGGEYYQQGEIVWPSLISTDNLLLKFTIATSESSPIPADGFTVVLGDPALGATLTSTGVDGEGLGARTIPGLVVVFDVFENNGTQLVFPGAWPQDPPVPYVGITRGEDALWERPYFIVNTGIPALATYGQTVSHDYILSLVSGYLTMSMDGQQILSGVVSAPPTAYLYVTASTGAETEKTVVSNISAVVTAP